MPSPIFVLGKQRSGTTWLANQLCQHPAIAGITHEAHHGVHESAFFSRMVGRYGDLSNRSNFLEFVQVLGASDYYRLTKLPKSFLFDLWGLSYEEVFRAVMDEYAKRKDARYWLEKSPEHTLLVEQLAAKYEDALFVAVIRDPESTIASMLSFKEVERSALGRRSQIVRSAVGWALFERTILGFASASQRLLVVRYERMASDLGSVMADVFRFLDLEPSDAVLTQRFEPNSSYSSKAPRMRAFNAYERALIHATVSVARKLPLRLMMQLRPVGQEVDRSPLPPWFFSLLSKEESASYEATAIVRRRASLR